MNARNLQETSCAKESSVSRLARPVPPSITCSHSSDVRLAKRSALNHRPTRGTATAEGAFIAKSSHPTDMGERLIRRPFIAKLPNATIFTVVLHVNDMASAFASALLQTAADTLPLCPKNPRPVVSVTGNRLKVACKGGVRTNPRNSDQKRASQHGAHRVASQSCTVGMERCNRGGFQETEPAQMGQLPRYFTGALGSHAGKVILKIVATRFNT